VDVLVLNSTNYHGFWMMLYQVASSQVEPEVIARPVRATLRRYRNVQFQVADVQGVDLERRIVETIGEDISYDYLVLAAGSTTHYFGNDGYRQRTLGLHDLNEAAELRDQVLTAFEQASREPDETRRKALMTIVVVGSGPTGVELAGAFAELIHGALARDYLLLDITAARVVLVEATSTILSSFPPSLQRSPGQAGSGRGQLAAGVDLLLRLRHPGQLSPAPGQGGVTTRVQWRRAERRHCQNPLDTN
jgi:NADH:ubiquinone reductase (H+-translocating)